MAETMNYTLGRGKLYFSAFRPGTTNPAGFEYVGHTTAIGITASTEKLDHWNMDSNVKFKDRSVTLSADFSMTFTTDHISPENVARFFLSENAERVSQADATGVSETITDIEIDRYYSLGVTESAPAGVRELKTVSVTVGGTALENEVDYRVDLENGLVYFIEGGAAVAGTDAVVTYGVEAHTFDRVVSGSSNVRGALKFVSDNATGTDATIYAPCVELSPNGDFQLKGDEWQELSFNVSVEQLPGRAALYREGRPERV